MKYRFFGLLACGLCLLLAACRHPSPAQEPASVPAEQITATQTTAPPDTTLSAQPAPTETEQPTQPQVTGTSCSLPEPGDSDFVAIKAYIPDVAVDLKYASSDNFTGQVIYTFQDAFLRYGTVKKLMAVQTELEELGLGLKIWDGFRPTAAQFRLWEVCPDSRYVADPNKGFSSHGRGNTVDLTLVDESGAELEMPTGFDDFSDLADREYSDCTETAAANALLLQDIMLEHGFSGYSGEWWHFTDTDRYPVEKVFAPATICWYYADCKEFISLRTQPDTSAEVITRILVNEEFKVLGWFGDFALAEYQGRQGYVLGSYIQPVA